MPKLAKEFDRLKDTYLFQKIAEKKKSYPTQNFIDLGIGDISKPLIPSCIEAMQMALKEFSDKKTFHGYGPSEGYLFLKEAISKNDYSSQIDPSEIFITSGAKDSASGLLDLFSSNNTVAIQNPSYPVYIGASLLKGMQIVFLPCLEENDFEPKLPEVPVDIIYLCSPNNPTGKAFTKKTLQKWVDYALKHESIILFDGAYEGYISSTAPRSIYEIDQAKKVAIELRSFSKKGGFTNLRCAYHVIPKECLVKGVSLHTLWKKRTNIKFGGVPYPIQKGAEALYSAKGQKELSLQLQEYQSQKTFLKNQLSNMGLNVYGGKDAPYIWCKTPKNLSSWEFFNLLLEKAQVICIPGEGFGSSGEGFVRFSAFPSLDILKKAAHQMEASIFCAT